MAKRGRKPIPVELKLLRGNPGHQILPTDTLKMPRGAPTRPVKLTGEARKEWERLTRFLTDILTEGDRMMLSALCVAWADFIEARGKLNALDKCDDDVADEVSKWQQRSNRAIEIFGKYAPEFGLTPSSRTRIRGLQKNPPETKEGWAKFG